MMTVFSIITKSILTIMLFRYVCEDPKWFGRDKYKIQKDNVKQGIIIYLCEERFSLVQRACPAII